jgi:hypothetical protein
MVAWHLLRTALGSVARSRVPARWPVSREPRLGEVLAQRLQKLPITRRGARQPLRNKRGIEVGEKLPVQALAAFEERFWICSDCRPARPRTRYGLFQCRSRGIRSAQDIGSSELRQCCQRPLPLAFCGPRLLKITMTGSDSWQIDAATEPQA